MDVELVNRRTLRIVDYLRRGDDIQTAGSGDSAIKTPMPSNQVNETQRWNRVLREQYLITLKY